MKRWIEGFSGLQDAEGNMEKCQSALKSIQQTASKITQGLGRIFPLFEAVGIVSGFEDVAVMGEPIEEGRGHLGVPKHLHPFAKAEIGISYLELGLMLVCAGVLQQGEETHGHRLPPL